MTRCAVAQMCEEALDGTDGTGLPPSEQPFHDSHKRALAVIDCLADAGGVRMPEALWGRCTLPAIAREANTMLYSAFAGYRPSTFRNYPLARLAGGQWEIYHVPTYSPAHDAPHGVVERWELSTSSRCLGGWGRMGASGCLDRPHALSCYPIPALPVWPCLKTT